MSEPTKEAIKIIDFHPEYFWATCQRGSGRYILDCGNRDANARLKTFVETVQANIDAHTQAIRTENAQLRERLRLAVEARKAWFTCWQSEPDMTEEERQAAMRADAALRAAGVEVWADGG